MAVDTISSVDKLPVGGFKNWSELILLTTRLVKNDGLLLKVAKLSREEAVTSCKDKLAFVNTKYSEMIGKMDEYDSQKARPVAVNDVSTHIDISGRTKTKFVGNTHYIAAYSEFTPFDSRQLQFTAMRPILIDDVRAVTKVFLKGLERLRLSEFSAIQQYKICDMVKEILSDLDQIVLLIANITLHTEMLESQRRSAEPVLAITPEVRAHLMVALEVTTAESIGGELTVAMGRKATIDSKSEYVLNMMQILQIPFPDKSGLVDKNAQQSLYSLRVSPLPAEIPSKETPGAEEVPANVAPVAEVQAKKVPLQETPLRAVPMEAVDMKSTHHRSVRRTRISLGRVLRVAALLAGFASISHSDNVYFPPQASAAESAISSVRPLVAGTAPVINAGVPLVVAPSVLPPRPKLMREISHVCSSDNPNMSFVICVKALLTAVRIEDASSILRECGISQGITSTDRTAYQRRLGRAIYHGSNTPWHLDNIIPNDHQRIRITWPQGSSCTNMTVFHELQSASGAWRLSAGHQMVVDGNYSTLMTTW